jgi:hypothetical protein
VLLTLELGFEPGLPVEAAAQRIQALERDVRARYPVIRRMSVQPVAEAAVAPAPASAPLPAAGTAAPG